LQLIAYRDLKISAFMQYLLNEIWI